jgi:hypothetical protein
MGPSEQERDNEGKVRQNPAGDWFSEWCSQYSDTFGLTTDADMRMLASWRKFFELAGYTAQELTDAMAHLASTEAPRYRSDHLPAIQLFIRDQRRRQREREIIDSETEWNTGQRVHDICQGTGRVIVPHLCCVVRGQFVEPYSQMAVMCTCKIGERLRLSSLDANKYSRRIMDLLGYEKLNPFWPEQMEKDDLRRRAKRESQDTANEADIAAKVLRGDPFQIALDRLMRRIGKMPSRAEDRKVRRNNEAFALAVRDREPGQEG